MSGDKQEATGRNHGERLANLEERVNHVATKSRILAGVIAGMVTATVIGLGLAKVLL